MSPHSRRPPARRILLASMIGTTIEFFDFYIYATAAVYLILQMIGVLFFALTIPISAIIADRIGGRRMLILATLAIIAFGFTFAPLFGAHDTVRVFFFLALGFSLTGFTYGPLGSALAALFPTAVRYTGTSLAFNLAGIVGASAAPYLATRLASDFGVSYVGYYLSGAGLLTLIALKLVGTRADHGVQPARESS